MPLAAPRSESSPTAPPAKRTARLSWTSVALAVLVGTSLLWFGVTAAASMGGHLPAISLGGAPAPGPTPTTYLYLTVAFNPSSGIDQYFPANFTIPANAPVVVTIINYDDGVNVVPEMYTHAAGVQGGMFSYDDGLGDAPTMMSSVPLSSLSHTFTMSSMPGMPGSMMSSPAGPMLNVPIPAATDVATPVTVTFTMTVSQTGDLFWVCMAPCDPGSMGMPGFMSGTIHVV